MSVVIGILLAIIVAWAALRALPAGAEGRLPLPYLIALIPFLWIPSLLLALASMLTGNWLLAGIATAFTVIIPLRVPIHRRHNRETSRETHRPVRGEPARRRRGRADANTNTNTNTGTGTGTDATVGTPHETGRTVTVMTLNCRYGRADAAAIVNAVRDHHVDVLALQELTQTLTAALDDAGIRGLLPHRQLGEDRPTDNGGFNGLWTRFEPVDSASSSVDIPAADVPMIAASPANDSTVIAFASAHTKSPMRGCRAWSQGILGLGRLAQHPRSATVPDGMHDPGRHAPHAGHADGTGSDAGHAAVAPRATVVLGDLNCGIDHPSFRRLLAAGFRDASMAATRRPGMTFPSWLAWPRIELDHVLMNGAVDAEHTETFTIPGSDHLATVATLQLR